MSKLIKLSLIFFIASCATNIPEPKKIVNNSAVVPMDIMVYENLVHKKYSHPFAIKGMKDAAEFRKLQKKDIESLSKAIADSRKKHKVLLNDKFKDKLRDDLKSELKLIEKFNSSSKSLWTYGVDRSSTALDPHYIFPQVKYNKLDLFLKNALTFSNQKLDKIFDGRIINEIYKGSYLLPARDITLNEKLDPKADLTIPSVISIMLKALQNLDEKAYKQYVKNHINSSSLFFWYQTPRGIDLNSPSIFASEYQNKKGMILVHNGYSFGGSMNNDNFRSKGFEAMPHDCSSYISHIINLGADPFSKKNYIIWTADGYNLNNFLNGKFVSYEALKDNITAYGLFAQKLGLVAINDISSFKEGDILLFRSFAANQNKTKSLGTGGHIGIILGTDGDDAIYLLSYIRNYENLNTGGFLLSAISHERLQDKSKAVMLFRYKGYQPKDQVKKDDIIDIKITDQYCQLIYKEKTVICHAGINIVAENQVGTFNLSEVFYRKDKILNLRTKLPIAAIEKNYGWCHDENKFTYIPSKICSSPESFYKEKGVDYNLILPVVSNEKGNTILLHVKSDKEILEGIAIDEKDLLELIKDVDVNTKIRVSLYDKN